MSQSQNLSPEDLGLTLARIAEVSGLSQEEVSKLYEQAKRGASIAEMFKIRPESLEAGYNLA